MTLLRYLTDSPPEKLNAGPELSARYAASMAGITSGVEFEDEDLGAVTGAMSPARRRRP